MRSGDDAAARDAGAPRSRRRKALLAAALALHLVVLYLPTAPAPGGGIPHVDKVVHLAVFLLVVWAARGAGLRRTPVLALAVAHAFVSELLQGLVLPDRSADPLDVVADLAGVALAAVLPVTRARAGGRAGGGGGGRGGGRGGRRRGGQDGRRDGGKDGGAGRPGRGGSADRPGRGTMGA